MRHLCEKLTKYSEEKILIKRRIPKGNKRKRSDIEIFTYKIFHFPKFHYSFCFDFRNHYISPKFLHRFWSK